MGDFWIDHLCKKGKIKVLKQSPEVHQLALLPMTMFDHLKLISFPISFLLI